MDTPVDGGLWQFFGQVGTQDVDENKNPSVGAGQTHIYRTGDAVVIQGANPSTKVAQKFVTAAAEGDTTNVQTEVGYNAVGDWLDYTRSYGNDVTNSAPAGTYNVYLYMVTDGTGVQAAFSQVTSGQGTTTQTTNFLGTFGTPAFSLQDGSWSQYEYVPLVDQFGNLASVSLGSGPQTLRSMVVGNPNIAYYMLMPVVPVLTPSFLYYYPDGLHPFEPTNVFTFTVGPAQGSNIVSSGIDVVINGVDVTASPKFTLTASGNNWTGSYPLNPNSLYTVAVNVTNTAGLVSTLSQSFDTFYVTNFQWEAVDYDFSTNGTTGGLFIDNPVPTGDINISGNGHLATNSYFGYPEGLSPVAMALSGVDIYWADDQPTTESYYRADSVGTEPSGDYPRPQFIAAQQEYSDQYIGPFQIGYFDGGNWLNYTRTFPTNTYNIWGRLSGGYGSFSNTTISMVTSGWGTADQTTNVLGSFTELHALGWTSYQWVPLTDANGNIVSVSLGGQATLKLTSAGGLNAGYFMLTPAPPIFQVTPSIVSGNLNLSFPTESGHTYTVVYKSSLSAPTWTAVGNPVAGTGAAVNVSETLTGTQGFYTVQMQ